MLGRSVSFDRRDKFKSINANGNLVPNNVGPEGLRPTKAWEIHPIKLLAER
jgi:hypothetical protein